MSWSRARQVLETVIGKMTNPSIGADWLKRLEKPECGDARRLAYCIAIDVASGAISPQDYADILDRIDNKELCGRKAFAKAFARHPRRNDLICASQLIVGSSHKDEVYIRVLSLRDFITYYKKDRSLAPDDVAAVREEYFSAHTPSDLSDISEWWTGTDGIVWVMSRTEYEELAAEQSRDNLASLLNDRLGLGKEPSAGDNDGRELVGVQYPERFPLKPLQPTALDASWRSFGWYYVSYGKDDGWGRTVSCSGDNHPLRERVHPGFEKLTSDYTGLPIGKILYRRGDREKLLASAKSRLESISPQAPPKFCP